MPPTRLPPSTHHPMSPMPSSTPSVAHIGPEPMDNGAASSAQDGQSLAVNTDPPLRRRVSMDEDLFYQRIMTAPSPRRPSPPPPYELEDTRTWRGADRVQDGSGDSPGGSRNGGSGSGSGRKQNADPRYVPPRTGVDQAEGEGRETLPAYSCSVSAEAVFQMKQEVEYTTKRAEDRRWHTVFVRLHGTALNIYHVKKDWGWGRSRDGPSICPDNPPWVRISKLEKTYSLHHADAGIAADYKKRRYVIRVRAESDQFLLCCIELQTFVKWLECLFAAIDVSAPIDERDFPRDMSIPRIQRLRWFRGEDPMSMPISISDPNQPSDDSFPGESPASSSASRRPSSPLSPTARLAADLVAASSQAEASGPGTTSDSEVILDDEDDEEQNDAGDDDGGRGDDGPAAPPPRLGLVHRLSTTSYPNLDDVDPLSGKWYPEHLWSSAHDLLYAKLCYSNLLFRSPRKSNYIVSDGKEWYVDWGTGRMIRVLPPSYTDPDYYFGPWQVVHTENRRI